jgi:predicted nucleic acid-binding protein
MVFWDTSALLKLYVAEPDSNAFASLAGSDQPLAISAWTPHELLCGLHRKELVQALKPGGAEAIYKRVLQQITVGALHVITYSAAVTEQAIGVIRSCYNAPKPVAIRSLDALHLGSALAAGATDLVSADKRMRAGAKIFDLRVLPNDKG